VHNIEGYAEECHAQTTSRRSVILGGASVAALTVGFPLCSFAEGSLTVDQFRTLSARLIGAGLPALDATAAGKLLDGFISMGRGPDLVVLAADPGTSVGTLADDIVAAWYSGLYTTSAGVAKLDVTKALLWHALDFTKPPGLCGGPTGYWADAPHS
jgi:hypothetical protein